VALKLLIKQVNPQYTKEMRRQHIQGVVKVQVFVSTTGDLETVRVISGDPALVSSAVDAVKQWKFKPFTLNGEPIEFETTFDINFSLADR
jgi:TonB family protein